MKIVGDAIFRQIKKSELLLANETNFFGHIHQMTIGTLDSFVPITSVSKRIRIYLFVCAVYCESQLQEGRRDLFTRPH